MSEPYVYRRGDMSLDKREEELYYEMSWYRVFKDVNPVMANVHLNYAYKQMTWILAMRNAEIKKKYCE